MYSFIYQYHRLLIDYSDSCVLLEISFNRYIVSVEIIITIKQHDKQVTVTFNDYGRDPPKAASLLQMSPSQIFHYYDIVNVYPSLVNQIDYKSHVGCCDTKY